MIRDKRTGKTKGYGFVSFSNPSDLAAAIKEMNGQYTFAFFFFFAFICVASSSICIIGLVSLIFVYN